MNLATRDVAVGAMAMTLTVTAVGIALLPRHATAAVPAAPAAPLAVAVPPPPLPPGARFSFVFRAGGTTFMQLEELGTWYPGDIDEQRVYQDDNWTSSFIHPLRGQFVPPDDRAWLGRAVVLDNGCRAHVIGFALVARVNGDPDWVETGDKTWDPVLLMSHGRQVIGGQLDGCDGSYARDASLPPAAVPFSVDDPALAARARVLLETSPAARHERAKWAETQHHRVVANPELVVRSRVLRHPVTGDTWVVVTEHRDYGCGDPETNLLGMYRLGPDGALVPVAQRALGELDEIGALLDVDGDGQLELIGHPALGVEQALVRASGIELSRTGATFIGCAC